MNFVAHIHLARSLEPSDPEVALGAALPDLAAMSGLTVDRERLTPGLRRGVTLHHRTDRAFHADPRFRAGGAELRRRLTPAGLPTGAVRAIGHAGWELLLDGSLLERPGVASGVLEVLATSIDLAPSPTDPVQARRWQGLTEALVTERWWMGYRSPLFVAERLYGRLRHRPRLAFDAVHLPDVARALERVRPNVEEASDETIAAVTSAITEPALSI